MKQRKYAYSITEMSARLLKIAKNVRGDLVISTLASIFGNLSHMGLMAFGALWILCAAGYAEGSALKYALLACLCGILIAVCRYLEGVYSHKGAYHLLAEMRVNLYREIDRISPAWMIDRKMGDVLNIAVSDIETLEFFFAHTIGPMFTVIILPVTSLCIAAHYSPVYAWILLPVYIMISVILPSLALKAGRGIGAAYRRDLGILKAVILEAVYGIKDIQIYSAGDRKLEEVLAANRQVNKAAHGLVLHQQTVSSLPNFFVYLARILVIAAAGWLSAHGKGNPVGTIVVSFAAAASFSSTFSLTFVVSHLLQTFAAAERLFLIEDARAVVKEAEHPEEVKEIQDITFDHVSFSYPSAEEKVLDDVSFTIQKGERVGLIGDSGTGKSTIIRLLMRFYDPSSGTISCNGIDTTKMSFKELHKRFGVLEQETYLFDGTIAENIGIGDPGADLSQIKKAAARAGLNTFIETLPDGYETQMGMMGSRLSGGERQRIGIARVLLKDPDVILLDEPTSSLDAMHEQELLQTLEENYAGKTLLIISHRMSTLGNCDRIMRLNAGKIEEVSQTSPQS